jgi:hypothetical protein
MSIFKKAFERSLSTLAWRYYYRLLYFSKYIKNGILSPVGTEDLTDLELQAHPLVRLFLNKDLVKMIAFIEMASTENMTKTDFERIDAIITQFLEILENLDYADKEECWNFFDSAFSVFLSDLEHQLESIPIVAKVTYKNSSAQNGAKAISYSTSYASAS